MKCFLNMFDHRELPGHRPSLVNADMCKERQVIYHVYGCFGRKNCIGFLQRNSSSLTNQILGTVLPSLHWQATSS